MTRRFPGAVYLWPAGGDCRLKQPLNKLHEEEEVVCRISGFVLTRPSFLRTPTCQSSLIPSWAEGTPVIKQIWPRKAATSSSQKKTFFCRTSAGTSRPSLLLCSTETRSSFLPSPSVSFGQPEAANCCWVAQPMSNWMSNSGTPNGKMFVKIKTVQKSTAV